MIRSPRPLSPRQPVLRQACAGLTLVELLVAVGVIAALALLGFGVMGRARAAAQQTQCLANMRNYGTGLLSYLNDARKLQYWNGNGTPAIGNSGESRFPTFERWVRPYLHLTFANRLRCPMMKEEFRSADYSYNYAGNSGLCMYYPRVFDVPAPMSRLVIAAEFSDFDHFYWDAPFNKLMWDVATGYGEFNGIPPDRDTRGRPQHHGTPEHRGLHMFFADGHAKLVIPESGNWRRGQTEIYANGTNDGIIYDYRQLSALKNGTMVFH